MKKLRAGTRISVVIFGGVAAARITWVVQTRFEKLVHFKIPLETGHASSFVGSVQHSGKGLTWARGWDTEEANALCVAEALR